ncbi:hypothetical protein ACG33_03635 [Steroidobacter denitrificans]|uniref:DUF2889 domain-containing protein n=1 Tax=Steroidobacter denitrificans TaxID=465721 RepID=A0A127F997_STEDE|nr:DUF2889 domain-containing protein [Steroidobacter denitrificans]AMN46211.1 hypothetical protein ACG33_03635 [Steroidobacter denitrificans]
MSTTSVTPICLDPFETGGYPIHCRTLIVEVFQDESVQGESGRVRALATILDLRKQGWLPTGGELQTAGIIHHMLLDVLVDTVSGRIERFEPGQQVVAFEASERTAGDSCRDPIHLLRGMVGETLATGNTRRLREIFGGPLGCSHLLTLAQLVVSFLPEVIERERREATARQHCRERGERIAKRIIVIDGFEYGDGNQEAAIQLTDVHTLPFAAMTGPLDRFGAQHEVRAIIRVDAAAMTISAFDAAERMRTRTDLGTAGWQNRHEELSWLDGHPVMQGLAPALLHRYAADTSREPLLAALINVAPSLVQSLSARVTRMIELEARRGGRLSLEKGAGIGGFPDSCYIWRSGGCMTKMRQALEQASD